MLLIVLLRFFLCIVVIWMCFDCRFGLRVVYWWVWGLFVCGYCLLLCVVAWLLWLFALRGCLLLRFLFDVIVWC